MASQGEREPGVLGMDGELLESMVQDGNPEQDIGVQEQFLPQSNPEPEMGAAAAAVYDNSPPPLRQNPPILAESAVERTRHGPAIRHAGGSERNYATNE